jgi:hypothetical protein
VLSENSFGKKYCNSLSVGLNIFLYQLKIK